MIALRSGKAIVASFAGKLASMRAGPARRPRAKKDPAGNGHFLRPLPAVYRICVAWAAEMGRQIMRLPVQTEHLVFHVS